MQCVVHLTQASLSARRAWIEIGIAETAKTSNADKINTSLNQLYIDRTAKAVVDNIVFVPRQNLINSISLIVHIGGNFFNIRYTTSARPSIAGYLFDTMQIVIIVVGRSPQGERG